MPVYERLQKMDRYLSSGNFHTLDSSADTSFCQYPSMIDQRPLDSPGAVPALCRSGYPLRVPHELTPDAGIPDLRMQSMNPGEPPLNQILLFSCETVQKKISIMRRNQNYYNQATGYLWKSTSSSSMNQSVFSSLHVCINS